MSDPLTDQLEQWGRSRADDLAAATPAVPDEFVRGVRRVRRIRRLQAGAIGALCIVLLGAGITLVLPTAPPAPGVARVVVTPSPSGSAGFTVAQILRANRHFESDDIRLPEVSLAWTREQPQLW